MKFNERTFNILSLLGVVAMLVIVAIDFLLPKPQVKMTRHDQELSIHQLKNSVDVQNKQLKTAKADVARYVWTQSADQVASQSLKTLTSITAKHKVQLLGFRPQKTTLDPAGFTHLPYLILLSGTFPNVEDALQDIGAPANRLAVSMVQFASSDANTDSVNATIGVIAFGLTQEAPSATTTSAK